MDLSPVGDLLEVCRLESARDLAGICAAGSAEIWLGSARDLARIYLAGSARLLGSPDPGKAPTASDVGEVNLFNGDWCILMDVLFLAQ